MGQGNRNMAVKFAKAKAQRGDYAAAAMVKDCATAKPFTDQGAMVSYLASFGFMNEVCGRAVRKVETGMTTKQAVRKAAQITVPPIVSAHW